MKFTAKKNAKSETSKGFDGKNEKKVKNKHLHQSWENCRALVEDVEWVAG